MDETSATAGDAAVDERGPSGVAIDRDANVHVVASTPAAALKLLEIAISSSFSGGEGERVQQL
jgi:hypothetical protein